MSLYVFNVKKDSAIVTADTRMCVDVGGELYRLNDTTEKLRVMDDMVITTGGVAWVGIYLLEVWKQSPDHSVKHLHELTLAALPYINMLAVALGAAEQDYLSNPYLLEFCILRYDPLVGHNVFYHIATSSEYELLEFHVDGVKRPSAKMFGGIDYEIVQDYFDKHPKQVETDYIAAVKTAYELATSEKIGGNLLIAKLDKGSTIIDRIPLKDGKDIRDYVSANGVTYNIVGKNLNISCPDVNGGVSKFQMDSLGFFQYNGRYYMAGDGDGGRIGMDHHWGIFGGPKALFDVTDTGYVKPSFVDDDGNMLLDKDGFPKDTDFLLGMKGKHFFRGTIHAEAGKFKGIVQAEDFMLKSGDTMQSILSDKGKILGDYIDARGINILDDDGDPIFYIDKTGIHWTPKHNPIKSQFSTTINGPWHDEFAANDEYRRDTSDGGTTWSKGYKFVAKDGLNGSDATVPKYITDTIISQGVIEAPRINANQFGIYPTSPNTNGSLSLYGNYSGIQHKMFELSYFPGDAAYINFESPAGAYANWMFENSSFYGDIDFSSANVTGITATFG